MISCDSVTELHAHAILHVRSNSNGAVQEAEGDLAPHPVDVGIQGGNESSESRQLSFVWTNYIASKHYFQVSKSLGTNISDPQLTTFLPKWHAINFHRSCLHFIAQFSAIPAENIGDFYRGCQHHRILNFLPAPVMPQGFRQTEPFGKDRKINLVPVPWAAFEYSSHCIQSMSYTGRQTRGQLPHIRYDNRWSVYTLESAGATSRGRQNNDSGRQRRTPRATRTATPLCATQYTLAAHTEPLAARLAARLR